MGKLPEIKTIEITKEDPFPEYPTEQYQIYSGVIRIIRNINKIQFVYILGKKINSNKRGNPIVAFFREGSEEFEWLSQHEGRPVLLKKQSLDSPKPLAQFDFVVFDRTRKQVEARKTFDKGKVLNIPFPEHIIYSSNQNL